MKTTTNRTGLDVSRTARRLDISVSSVYRLIENNELRRFRSGPKKGYRVTVESIEHFEQKRRFED